MAINLQKHGHLPPAEWPIGRFMVLARYLDKDSRFPDWETALERGDITKPELDTLTSFQPRCKGMEMLDAMAYARQFAGSGPNRMQMISALWWQQVFRNTP